MKRHFVKVLMIILVTLLLGYFDLPTDKQKEVFPLFDQALTFPFQSQNADGSVSTYNLQQFLAGPANLGLDLQGGSQLDYKIDLRKVPAAEKKTIIDGILNVITKRVNGLGVAEPNIYTSDVADEKHMIVELAGIKDLEEAKKIVGKTIQLEFKEEKTGPVDPNEKEKVKANAQQILEESLAGKDLRVLGQEEQQANPGKVFYGESKDFEYKDQVTALLAEDVFKLEPGKTADHIIESDGAYTVDASGKLQKSLPGYYLVKLLEKRDQEREVSTPKQIKVRHVLVAFKGMQGADESITRTEDEAKARAEEALNKVKAGAAFEDIAKEYSDDKSNKDKGGELSSPVQNDGSYVKEFEDAANQTAVGQLSAVFKSPFGFHFLKVESVTEAKTEKKVEPQVKYIQVYFDNSPEMWQETGLSGEHFTHADVQFNQYYQPYVSIQFNDEGAKLFEEITARNVGKQVAIFVGGQEISAPRVNERISGGRAQISGNYTIEEANSLARDLNTGAIPAPIVLAGQYTIGATLGQDALSKSLYAGLIGFLLVAIFMTLYYRLPGLLATAALTVYCAILIFLLKAALPIGIALTISVLVFGYLVNKILKSHDSGPEKAISLILACFILFFLAFILSTSVVMTLAGIAGVVLSIGMAVDANILIFERVKEELRDGRSLGAAIEVGFDRAWNSIRDSNFSSLITCGILFYFGSSIIQGFAFNLAAGILVSMFTAITITKTLLNALVNTKLAEKLWLFGTPKKKEKKLLPIVQQRKLIYWFSGIILALSLLAIPVYGIKAGLDFTGGTLMEFKFKEAVTVEQLKDALQKGAEKVNGTPAAPAETKTDSTQQTAPTIENAEEKLDFSKAHVIPSENGYIVKAQHVSTAAHDVLFAELKKTFPGIEESRFSTVGPTVGSSLQYRAVFAVVVASVMIVLYIAFAFRRVPRHIGKWRFGLTAIVALLHDLGMMLGVYVFLGAFLGVEVDALFITALLTIMGFSVHDTIVVFDRIREKLKYQKKDETFEDVANQAVNETMARSINTSFSVLLTLLALVIFGSETIRYFVLSLLIGIISGTYSSIFVATPLLVDWQNYVRNRKK